MNDILEDKLKIITEDEVLIKAIRAVFDEVIEEERPRVEDHSNQLLGQKYRAYREGGKLVDKAFKKLMMYRSAKREDKKFNRGK